MTALSAPHNTFVARRGSVITDSLTMTWRLLRTALRIPDLLVFSTIQPVMFVLLFRYVFGGAIDTGGIPYVQFLMPGIFVQTLAFNGAATGIGVADDMAKGIVDRFRTLPISPAAMFIGRAIADTIRSAFVLLIMVAVGMATGYRFHSTVGDVVAGVALMLFFSFCFSWIGIYIGLIVKSVEAASSGGFLWLFPLTFASSAFVPVSSMPSWLQTFAEHNPITLVIDAVRGWFDHNVQAALNLDVTASALQSLCWLVGVLVVFVPLCVHRFRKLSA
ncbi:ABC-2 type transport system permease protein/oleandomycin transport system permease protein [Jatrophihabitans sp. GAS493]|uniref:ABC transporter permease n=1 Tax=Jatrophihabitans sp. GAS493 TaxID=1907575 RepID=UPI000BC01AC5|nr:ABC transporter permease [Jatrophihabitans sp. GAS493]SOD75167.1 ABC-2 type transport system permease protein/oleandomycin transport system permease protein [Jatrophihabitans sp. GAS493]